MDTEKVEEYVEILTKDPSLVDNLPDDIVDVLINYLQIEIANKERLLEELQKE